MRWSGSESGPCTRTKWLREIVGEDPGDARAAYSEPRGRVTLLTAPTARADEELAQLLRQVVAMTKNTLRALYLVVWIAVIVSVDFLFLRHHTTERLIVNIGMVLGFAVFYVGVLKKR
jgi:hypothetical protein